MERRDKPEWQQELAQERIEILFREALAAAKSGRLDRANRYVYLARRLAMKFNLRFEREQRRKFCHNCYHYLLPGKNVRVRINPKTKAVEMTCLDCKHVNRYPYLKEKNQRLAYE
jgi:ribonuclease P protein subunit RPR2